MSDADEVEAEFERISARAAIRNRERGDRLRVLCSDLGADTPDEAWDTAAELAHQIAGSSGTFGNILASTVAREVLEALRARDAARAAERIGALTAALAG